MHGHVCVLPGSGENMSVVLHLRGRATSPRHKGTHTHTHTVSILPPVSPRSPTFHPLILCSTPFTDAILDPPAPLVLIERELLSRLQWWGAPWDNVEKWVCQYEARDRHAIEAIKWAIPNGKEMTHRVVNRVSGFLEAQPNLGAEIERRIRDPNEHDRLVNWAKAHENKQVLEAQPQPNDCQQVLAQSHSESPDLRKFLLGLDTADAAELLKSPGDFASYPPGNRKAIEILAAQLQRTTTQARESQKRAESQRMQDVHCARQIVTDQKELDKIPSFRRPSNAPSVGDLELALDVAQEDGQALVSSTREAGAKRIADAEARLEAEEKLAKQAASPAARELLERARRECVEGKDCDFVITLVGAERHPWKADADKLVEAPFSQLVCGQLVQQALCLPCASYLVGEYCSKHWKGFYREIARQVLTVRDRMQILRGVRWIAAFLNRSHSPASRFDVARSAAHSAARRFARQEDETKLRFCGSAFDMFSSLFSAHDIVSSVPTLGDSPGPDTFCPTVLPSLEPGQRGLPNLGNSCYMNAIVRAVSHEVFTHPLMFTTELVELVNQLWRPDDQPGGRRCATAALLQHVQVAAKFPRGHQQDAQQALGVLLVSEQHRADVFSVSEVSTTSCSACGYTSSKRTDPDPWCLLLEMTDCTSLEECLGRWSRKETLDADNSLRCNCTLGNTGSGTKQLQMEGPPQLLVLALKRFEFLPGHVRGERLTTPISFPLTGLDVSPFLQSTNGPCLYDLYAVVRHKGTTADSGHYTTAALHPSRQIWHEFDDASVTLSDSGPTLPTDHKQAYMLFYQRREGLSSAASSSSSCWGLNSCEFC
jgi:hypothetical protein